LSLNSLVAGCNQKSARDPVMALNDAEVLQAIDALRAASLVIESSGSRVARYEHNVARAWALPGASVALLAALMLRGPQTAAELRANCERLHRFADVSSVEAYLDELTTRAGGPFVLELPRQPGAREARWMHLISGPPDPATLAAVAAPATGGDTVTLGEIAALKRNVDDLARDVADLKVAMARLMEELGVRR
jgi:uncharacterized protein YceH (UPF0502 family)